MDFESQIEKIAKDIRDREDRELALAFTNIVGSLLRENGVFVKTSRYEFETDSETDKNKYIIKKEYGVSFDGLDFTEHDKEFKDEIENLKRQIEKLASIRMRCHESARDSFDLGNYGCLHIVTVDELKNSNEKVAKIESELFDVQKSADEYYNKCIDLTNQIEKLKSELKTKDVNDRTIELPFDPLETANMLINATYKRENCMTGTIYDRDVYDIDDLEQIAEHLLVYCKHNREDEE